MLCADVSNFFQQVDFIQSFRLSQERVSLDCHAALKRSLRPAIPVPFEKFHVVTGNFLVIPRNWRNIIALSIIEIWHRID
jgi:hypothetical protein